MTHLHTLALGLAALSCSALVEMDGYADVGVTDLCSSDQKRCGDRCVGMTDPATGCGSAGCEPCDVPGATAGCEAGGCVVAACREGMADCDGLVGNGCEADLQSDGGNCGVCGHGCCGGICERAECLSKALAFVQEQPTEIVLDDTHAYWVLKSSGAVMSVPKDGHQEPRLLSNASAELIALAVGEVHVFFGGPTTQLLYADKVNGGTALELDPRLVNYGTRAVAVRNGFAFYLTSDGLAPGGDTFLRRVALDGSSSAALARVFESPRGVVVDDDYVYFLTAEAIRRTAVEGTDAPVEVLVDEMSDASGFDSDDTHLYWLDGGKVSRMDKDGANQQPVAFSPPLNGGDIAVSTDDVFFTNDETGVIYRVAKNGGPVASWVEGQRGIESIAVDDGCVYWANPETGEIRVLAQP